MRQKGVLNISRPTGDINFDISCEKTITTLVGTTWRFNSTLSDFNIIGYMGLTGTISFNNTTISSTSEYNNLRINANFSSGGVLSIYSQMNGNILPVSTSSTPTGVVYMSSYGWMGAWQTSAGGVNGTPLSTPPTITITGGSGATNTYLIQAFKNNATQIS